MGFISTAKNALSKALVDKTFDGDFNITIYHRISNGYEEITPIVEDGVKWETERQGSPGKLTFKIYKDKNKNLTFQEGDEVHLNFNADGKGWMVLFYGFIFTKKRNKDGWIDVTAYDALRYFKNKDTYVFTDKKASDILKMIANDYHLKIGTIEETSYVIGQRVEDDQSLFDIVQNALDETLAASNKMYVLYCDGTGVCLQNIANMKTNLVINQLVAEDFDYSSSIDDETYNEILIYYDDEENNKRNYYHRYDNANIHQWGRLRYTESIQNPTNAQDRVKKLLTLYNRKKRKLDVKGAFGDCHCRAGASVIVELDLGDITISNYMLIEKATHTFKKNEYRMDLTLDGFNEEISEANVTYNSWTLQGETKKTDQITPDQVAEPTSSDVITLTIKLATDFGGTSFSEDAYYDTVFYKRTGKYIRYDSLVVPVLIRYYDENGDIKITEFKGNYQKLKIKKSTVVYIGYTYNKLSQGHHTTIGNVIDFDTNALSQQGWTPRDMNYQFWNAPCYDEHYKVIKDDETLTISWKKVNW